MDQSTRMMDRRGMINVAKELEQHDIPGPSRIRQLLTKARAKKVNTLVNAVVKFQEDNGVKIKTLPPALQLLELHSVKRSEFYEQAVTDLTDCLLKRLRVLGEEKTPDSIKRLEAQLDKCFDMYKMPQFRPVVLETLKQLPVVPDKYLQAIIQDTSLYNECDITVRQQIWLQKQNEELFIKALSPSIDSYIYAKQAMHCTIDTSTNFFTFETTRARRQWKQIKDMMHKIGNHVELFALALKLVRIRYTATGEIHLCSLRLELVMAAHDAGMDALNKSDECHALAWCLDACVRDKKLEGQQLSKLKSLIDGFKKTDADALTDFAMIAADPHVMHFLCSLMIKKLRDSIGHLPRESISMQVIIRLLSLAAISHDISMSKAIPNEIVESIHFTKFLPLFASMMVEDSIRQEALRLPGVDIGDELAVVTNAPKTPDLVLDFLRASPVASLLWIHYCSEMFPNRKRISDPRALARYTSQLNNLKHKLGSTGVWCHLLIYRVTSSHQLEHFLNDPIFYQYIVEDLLLQNVENDPCVKYQLLRLINHIGFLWGIPACNQLLEKIEPEMRTSVDPVDRQLFCTEFIKVRDKLNPRSEETMQAQLSPTGPARILGGMGSPPPVRQYPSFGSGTPRTSFG